MERVIETSKVNSVNDQLEGNNEEVILVKAEAYTTQTLPQRNRATQTQSSRRLAAPSAVGLPGDPDDDNGENGSNLPICPQPNSVEQRQQELNFIYEEVDKVEKKIKEATDSDSESEEITDSESESEDECSDSEETTNSESEEEACSILQGDYQKLMQELDRQSSKKTINIEVGDQSYILKNPSRESSLELADKLADKMYNSIRESDTDIGDIAGNLGYKADNIKKVKDHIFNNEHDLDRYGPDEIERKKFDPDLQQALAWKRLETGTHTQDDITWIKHECAERHHEEKYGSGYTQSRFDGAPWEN